MILSYGHKHSFAHCTENLLHMTCHKFLIILLPFFLLLLYPRVRSPAYLGCLLIYVMKGSCHKEENIPSSCRGMIGHQNALFYNKYLSHDFGNLTLKRPSQLVFAFHRIWQWSWYLSWCSQQRKYKELTLEVLLLRDLWPFLVALSWAKTCIGSFCCLSCCFLKTWNFSLSV